MFYLGLFVVTLASAMFISDIIIGLCRFFRHRAAVRRQLEELRK